MGLVHRVITVQDLLEDFERKISKMVPEEKDYRMIVSQGSYICEAMLIVVIEDKGFTVDDQWMVRNDHEPGTGNMTPLRFAWSNEDILPEECRYFVKHISVYRNQAVNDFCAIGFETAAAFAKAFDYFTLWFMDYLAKREIIDEESRRKLECRLFSLEYFLRKPSSGEGSLEGANKAITQIREEAVASVPQHPAASIEAVLLQKLAETTKMLESLSMKVDRIEEQGERIEEQGTRIEEIVNEMQQQLMMLTEQIGFYQSLVQRQLEMASSDDEKERIMQAYADECAVRIVEQTKPGSENEIYELVKNELIESLGNAAWNKMEAASQTFLITAKVMFRHLENMDDIYDYSGVCVLVTKALEVEMDKRFYTEFLAYLDGKYYPDYSQYPTALVFHDRQPLSPEKFTMGNIAYVLCYIEDNRDTAARKMNNRQKLVEYCSACLFPGLTEAEILAKASDYAQDIETIRVSYRNPSAHTNELQKINAKECFDYVLDVEKVLKKMLDSFAF